MSKRRDYGSGSIFQRCEKAKGCPPILLDADGKKIRDEDGRYVRPEHTCRGMWVGAIENGWTENLKRDKVRVYAKTEPAVKRKLRDMMVQKETTGQIVSTRTTVKVWAEKYLELRVDDLSPKAYNAAASPIRKWIIPTIGHRRLAQLTANDIRAIDNAQFNLRSKRYPNGLSSSTADATRRVLYTMLRRAEAEGHRVPSLVYLVPRPGAAISDREPLTIEDTVKMLFATSPLPFGVRWLLALLYGARQGEVLGLIEETVDFDKKEIRLEWQLQALPYIDNANKSLGFRTPRNYKTRHVHESWHLVRPKSKKGFRVLPMDPAVEKALKAMMKRRPKSTCEDDVGLLFLQPDGTPIPDYTDRREWIRLQKEAGVMHPGGKRPYHLHECRNFAATRLDANQASDTVITSLLGHASINTSRRYMRAESAGKAAAVAAVVAELRAAGWSEDSGDGDPETPVD